MRGWFFVLVLLVVGVGALGYYQGWFNFSTAKTEKGVNVNVSVDKEKMGADKERAKEKLGQFTGQIKEKAEGVGSGQAPAKGSDDGRK
jgi:hypothetical protein